MIDEKGRPYISIMTASQTWQERVWNKNKTRYRDIEVKQDGEEIREYDMAKAGWHKSIKDFKQLVFSKGVSDVTNLELGIFLYVETWEISSRSFPCYHCGTSKWVYLRDISNQTELTKRCFRCDKTDLLSINKQTAKLRDKTRISEAKARKKVLNGEINYIPQIVRQRLNLRHPTTAKDIGFFQ